MKNFVLSLLLLGGSASVFGQAFPCDIATFGLSISPSSVTMGQTADFKFSVYNAGSNAGCTIPANSVTVVLSLPSTVLGAPRFYQFQSVVSPVGGVGTYFTYTYDPIDNIVIGTNQAPIPNGAGELDVTIRVIGIAITPGGGATSTLNLQQGPPTSNNPGNDVGSAPLIVTSVVAVRLGEVEAVGGECNATLTWNTAREDAGNTFDVEYSPDGVNFVKVATIPGKETVTGANYKYSYNQGQGKGFYRLRINSATGSVAYSKIVTATVHCDITKVFLYPNPVKEGGVLNVSVAGFSGVVKGEMMTAAGQVINNKTLPNGVNQVSVKGLAQGTYSYRVTADNGEVQTFKVVVVK